MNNVCIRYANGNEVKYSVFPLEYYDEGRKNGTIVGARSLNIIERIIVRIMGM